MQWIINFINIAIFEIKMFFNYLKEDEVIYKLEPTVSERKL